jgi:carbamoyl-phosphate synthase large subunit
MSSNILIFGGSVLQASIIRQAKEMGFTTILLDPAEKPYAKNIADEFIQVAGDDYKNTLNIAQKYNAKGLVTAATDHPLPMMSKIAKAHNLPFPSYDSIDSTLDKWKFKELLYKHNIPHAKGQLISHREQIDTIPELFKFPVILKPIKGSGSKGVFKCETIGEVKDFFDESLNYSKDREVLVEEYLRGDEISVEALVYDNKLNIIQITDKILSPPPYNVEMGHIQPSKYSFRFNEIYETIKKTIEATGLNNCAIHPEFKINENGVFIIEIGPRLGGDYITSHLVPLSTGVNIEKELINISSGNSPLYYKVNKSAMIEYFDFEKGRVFRNLFNSFDEKFPSNSFFHYELGLNNNTKSKTIKSSFDRYGYYIIDAIDRNELLSKREELLKKANLY